MDAIEVVFTQHFFQVRLIGLVWSDAPEDDPFVRSRNAVQGRRNFTPTKAIFLKKRNTPNLSHPVKTIFFKKFLLNVD